MEKGEKHFKDWNKFLDENNVRNNLVKASLYLFSYELLKNSIVDKIKDFYSIGIEDGKEIYSENYNKKVARRKIDGKQNIFLSSLYWLEENGAIIKDDIIEIREIREFRNTVAHKLDKLIADSDYNFDDTKQKRVFQLIRKIEIWYIKEIEIPTNPEFDGKEINDDEIIAGKEIFYTYIKNITEDLLKGPSKS